LAQALYAFSLSCRACASHYDLLGQSRWVSYGRPALESARVRGCSSMGKTYLSPSSSLSPSLRLSVSLSCLAAVGASPREGRGRRGVLADLPWEHGGQGPWRSRHLCWGGASPPADALGKFFSWPAEHSTCEFRSVCYRTEAEDFEYYGLQEQRHRQPPAVSMWSGPAEVHYGGYDLSGPRKLPSWLVMVFGNIENGKST
jgi:hypothetical protein